MPGGGDHVLGGGVLGHEGRGAGLECAEELLVAGVHGQHDDARWSAFGLADLPRGVEAAAVGQPHVDDDDVGR